MVRQLYVFLLSMAISFFSWAGDPTRPPGFDTNADKKNENHITDSQFFISHILKRKTFSLVVINGRILRLGDHIHDFRVSSIGQDHACLNKGLGDLCVYFSTQEEETPTLVYNRN